MGHELHITRRNVWSDKGNDIKFEEFVNYVKNDPEFTHPGKNGEEFAEWKSPTTEYESWIWFYDGNIYSKNPEPELINKMVAIAKTLKATAQGDDGEIYISATEIQRDDGHSRLSADGASQNGANRSGMSLGKKMLIAFLLGCVLLGLRLVIFRR